MPAEMSFQAFVEQTETAKAHRDIFLQLLKADFIATRAERDAALARAERAEAFLTEIANHLERETNPTWAANAGYEHLINHARVYTRPA